MASIPLGDLGPDQTAPFVVDWREADRRAPAVVDWQQAETPSYLLLTAGMFALPVGVLIAAAMSHRRRFRRNRFRAANRRRSILGRLVRELLG